MRIIFTYNLLSFLFLHIFLFVVPVVQLSRFVGVVAPSSFPALFLIPFIDDDDDDYNRVKLPNWYLLP